MVCNCCGAIKTINGYDHDEECIYFETDYDVSMEKKMIEERVNAEGFESAFIDSWSSVLGVVGEMTFYDADLKPGFFGSEVDYTKYHDVVVSLENNTIEIGDDHCFEFDIVLRKHS